MRTFQISYTLSSLLPPLLTEFPLGRRPHVKHIYRTCEFFSTQIWCFVRPPALPCPRVRQKAGLSLNKPLPTNFPLSNFSLAPVCVLTCTIRIFCRLRPQTHDLVCSVVLFALSPDILPGSIRPYLLHLPFFRMQTRRSLTLKTSNRFFCVLFYWKMSLLRYLPFNQTTLRRLPEETYSSNKISFLNQSTWIPSPEVTRKLQAVVMRSVMGGISVLPPT